MQVRPCMSVTLTVKILHSHQWQHLCLVGKLVQTTTNLGTFDTEIEAAKAVDDAYMEANDHHLNSPSSDASEEWRDCVAKVDVLCNVRSA
jgi:hypothetical protein